MDCVRQASIDRLYSSLSERLSAMLHCGTTLVEAKSGYGPDFDNEYKMLEVIERAKRKHPISVSTTYCGAPSEGISLLCMHSSIAIIVVWFP